MTIEQLEFKARSELSHRKQNLDLTPIRKILKILENKSNQQSDESDEDRTATRFPYLVPPGRQQQMSELYNQDIESVLPIYNQRSVSVVETRSLESEEDLPSFVQRPAPIKRFMKKARKERLIRVMKNESEDS